MNIENAESPHIVVEDPRGEWWEGAVVDAQRARQLRADGVVLLPCAPSLFDLAGGGFAKRAWGGGFPLDFGLPRMVCPLSLFLPRGPDGERGMTLHWRARLAVDQGVEESLREGKRLEGQVRFAACPQPHTNLAPYGAREVPLLAASLGNPDERGGWYVGGRGGVNPGLNGGYSAFALYGACPGLRVVWLAASLALD